MDSITNCGPTFLLRYRLVLIIKGKRNVITEDISIRLKEVFISNAQLYSIILEDWTYEPSYISIVFKTRITSDLIRFINAYKTASSRIVKNEFPFLKSNLYKGTFWNRYYCLLTIGENTDMDKIIMEYINRKKMK